MPRIPSRKMPAGHTEKPRLAAAPGTRARIATTALELFNEHGAHAVSTRHVAAALGISPGNLYYHFGNKEEIVAELYTAIEADLRELLRPSGQAPAAFAEILAYVDRVLAHLWRYRFFYRDLPTLLPTVPGLRGRYGELAAGVVAGARRIYAGMVEAGWMQAAPAELDRLATNGWLVLTGWLPYRQIQKGDGALTTQDVHEGVRHFAALFGAHLRPGPRAQLERLLGGLD